MEKPISTLLRKLTVRVEKLEKLAGIKSVQIEEPKEEITSNKKKKKKG